MNYYFLDYCYCYCILTVVADCNFSDCCFGNGIDFVPVPELVLVAGLLFSTCTDMIAFDNFAFDTTDFHKMWLGNFAVDIADYIDTLGYLDCTNYTTKLVLDNPVLGICYHHPVVHSHSFCYYHTDLSYDNFVAGRCYHNYFCYY